jgi:thioredoxin reductase
VALVGIVGGGIGGIATAVQLKRYGIDALIFEREAIGGLIRNAYSVENTMFFPDGIKGVKVVEILQEYVKKYELKILYEEVVRILKKGNLFRVITNKGEYTFKYVVIASGTKPKRLNLNTSRLFYHVIDVPEGNFERVLIIGGGDVAFDYALTMSERAKEVIILTRSEPKALPLLREYIKERKNVSVVKGQVLDVGERLAKTTAGNFEFDVILVAIGREPNLDFAREVLNEENVFLVGDVKNGIYRQTALSIADGIKTAMEIWRRERYGDT